MSADTETAVRALYAQLLAAWNERNAGAFGALFATGGEMIGFDGSLMTGPVEIAATLQEIFAHHPTPPFVSKVHSVRLLSPEVAVLRAAAGMVPPGQTELEPKLNAWQTLVAIRHEGAWRVAQFQNTPAQFHGRPELVQAMTAELRALL